jgi:gamma-glutamyltranspeptidase/glutathione hydrolase
MARFALLATNKEAQEVGATALASGASALGAALTAYFYLAGKDRSLLFAPLSLLVGGVGSGVFAYDGRCRQPGKGAKRPRGFVSLEDVVPAAHAAAPGSLAAISLAIAFHPGTTLAPCVKVGAQVAKAEGALKRAQLLEAIGSRGATTLQSNSVKKSFLADFGPIEGGGITSDDLSPPEHVNLPAVESPEGWSLPWRTAPDGEPVGRLDSIVAIDARGLTVALTVECPERRLNLEDFEVALPAIAEPVMRGVSRLAPGSPLLTFADLRLGKDESGRISGVTARLDRHRVRLALLRDPESREIFIPSVAASASI